MQKREKNLLILTGVAATLFIGGLSVDRYVMQPLGDLDRRIMQRESRLADLEDLQADSTRATIVLEQAAERTYAPDAERARARLGARLAELIGAAGLSASEFTIRPLEPRRMRGGQEIGVSVRGEGPMDQVVDLLYLLDREPVLNRTEGLNVRRASEPGVVTVQFQYMSVVIDAVVSEGAVALEDDPHALLSGEGRSLLAGIVERDLLRPYVAAPPPPPPEREPEPRHAEREPEPDPGPGLDTYRVVSLSQWEGQSEIHVWDSNEERTLRFAPGDVVEMLDAEVVMVDYRSLPLPSNPALLSYSRVILKQDGDYVAVERGQTLGDTYRMRRAELPASLAHLYVDEGGTSEEEESFQ